MKPLISVIIPSYNEEAYLPKTLERLLSQRGSFEVIVVDGGSTDRTLEMARSYRGLRVLESPKGKACQMNLGAQVARGQVFLFLHADTLLGHGALEKVARLASRFGPESLAGAFWHRFDSRRPSLRFVSLLDNLRCWWTRVPYGDQAPFVGRKLFFELGGFREDVLPEDLEFSRRLARAGRVWLVGPAVETSARKFSRMGPWRAFGLCVAICTRAFLGLDTQKAARAFFEDIR